MFRFVGKYDAFPINSQPIKKNFLLKIDEPEDFDNINQNSVYLN